MLGNNNVGQPKAETSVVGQQFLRFHLFPDTTVLLPVTQMIEVLTIPVNQVVPIPNMSPWVMGVYNWRGEILWNIDLGSLLGLTPLYQQAITRTNYTTIVLVSRQQLTGKNQITGRQSLGVVVDKVEDMEWCNTDLIQSPPQSSITTELAPFLRGYWVKQNGEMLMVLDGEAIILGVNKE